jgi:dynein heavy chain
MLPLQVLIRPEILPSGQLADPSSWATPALELAPGFKAPLPSSFEALQQYIENSLPAESPVVYGMHPNAELSLLTSLGETLFRTITDVSGGSTGGRNAGAACRIITGTPSALQRGLLCAYSEAC